MSTSDNYSTLWVQSNLNAMAIGRAQQAIASTGRALPCSVVATNGALVTVKFEVQGGPWTLPHITIPKAESQWIRNPTQIGDVGLTLPADTFVGGISGQGSGIADQTKDYGNLSTLVFVPIASTKMPPTADPTKAWVNGPTGAVLSDEAQTASVTVAPNLVTVRVGGLTWLFTPAGLTLANNVVAENHLHPTPSGISGSPMEG